MEGPTLNTKQKPFSLSPSLKNDFKKIVQAAMNQSIPGKESEFIESLACPSWATLCTLMNESKTSSSTSNSGRGGGGAVGSSSTASSSSSTWPCRHCTFVNHDTDLCEMCGLPHD